MHIGGDAGGYCAGTWFPPANGSTRSESGLSDSAAGERLEEYARQRNARAGGAATEGQVMTRRTITVRVPQPCGKLK